MKNKKTVSLITALLIMLSAIEFTAFSTDKSLTADMIDRLNIKPVTLYENCGGYWNEAWDEDITIEGKSYYIYFYDDPETEVILKDGTVLSGNGGFWYNDTWYSLNIEEQSYENQLKSGENTLKAFIVNYETDFTVIETSFTVNIIESPVESISAVVKRPFYCGLDFETESDFNSELMGDIIVENSEFTVTCRGGKTIKGDYRDIQRAFGDFYIEGKGIQTPVIGMNKAEINFMNKSCEVELEVISSPYNKLEIFGENELYISLLKEDGTADTFIAEYLDERAGDVLYSDGFLLTDKGAYQARFNKVPNNAHSFSVSIGSLESNIIKSNKWYELFSEKLNSVVTFMIIDELNGFNGVITPEYLDPIILFSGMEAISSIRNYADKKIIDGKSCYPISTDFAKKLIAVYFDTTDIDLTQSSMYDEATQCINYPDFDWGIGGDFYTYCKFDDKSELWITSMSTCGKTYTVKWNSELKIVECSTAKYAMWDDETIPGDINGDGKITVVDAKWILMYIVNSREFSNEQKLAADVNRDEKITVVDAKRILRTVAGITTVS